MIWLITIVTIMHMRLSKGERLKTNY